MGALTGPEEAAEWAREHDAGRLVIVALDVFADVSDDGHVRRIRGPTVPALSFVVPHGDDNLDHARDMVRLTVEALAETLAAAGLRVVVTDLLRRPVGIELAPELERLLH